MIIYLSPILMDATLHVVKRGRVLEINGEVFDFSPMPEGASIPRHAINSEWFADTVTLEGGVLEVTLLLPISRDASEAARFPEPIVNPEDGELELPK